MPALAPGQILRVNYYTWSDTHSQIGINRLRYIITNVGTATEENLASFITARVSGAYVQWLPSAAKFVGVETQIEAPTKSGAFQYLIQRPGTYGSNYLPLQNSGFLRFKTPSYPFHGGVIPARTGRAYIPFPSTSGYDAAAGKLSQAGLTRLINVMSVLGPTLVLATAGNFTAEHVIRTRNTVDGVGEWAYPIVNYYAALKTIATQRRRGDFGRINPIFGGAQ